MLVLGKVENFASVKSVPLSLEMKPPKTKHTPLTTQKKNGHQLKNLPKILNEIYIFHCKVDLIKDMLVYQRAAKLANFPRQQRLEAFLV